MAHLLEEHLTNDTARHYSQIIKSSGNSLMSIINDILDFSKLEAGKMVIESVPCSSIQLFKEVIAVFQCEAQQKRFALTLAIDSKTSAYFRSDPVRISRITTNLLSNAMNFTSEAEIALRVSMPQDNLLRI